MTWVRTVLAETLRRMEADCKDPSADQPRRGQIWEMFRIRLLEPVFNDAPQAPYEQLIERFGLRSPTDASNMLLSAKADFQDAPEPGDPGIRGAGRRHGGGNPGAGRIRGAPGKTRMNACARKMHASNRMDKLETLCPNLTPPALFQERAEEPRRLVGGQGERARLWRAGGTGRHFPPSDVRPRSWWTWAASIPATAGRLKTLERGPRVCC